jgi:hypothetical protein
MLCDNVLPILLGWVLQIDHNNLALRGLIIGLEIKLGANIVNIAETPEPFRDEWLELHLTLKLAFVGDLGITNESKIITILPSIHQEILSIIGRVGTEHPVRLGRV